MMNWTTEMVVRARALGGRNWVALLRSPANTRASIAPDNRPRNATQVIVSNPLCRSKFVWLCGAVRRELAVMVGTSALIAEPVVAPKVAAARRQFIRTRLSERVADLGPPRLLGELFR